MAVQVAGTCLHWSQLYPTAHALSSSCQATFSSAISSSASSKRSGSDLALNHRSLFLGDHQSKLWRTRSSKYPIRERRRRRNVMELRASNSSEEDEAFIRKLRELVLKLKLQQGDCINHHQGAESRPLSRKAELRQPLAEPEDLPFCVERKANSVDIPLSLRIIKRKKQEVRWDEELRELAGEPACCSCSVRKAFSSMVFIIREIQSFALRMRGALLDDDLPDLHLQGVVARVQHEMHASFVWLFQHIFSCTPTLMVSLMLLLANFSVYSTAVASPCQPPPPRFPTVAAVSAAKEHRQPRFDQSSVKTFSVGGSGGGKIRPVAGATDDGRWDGFSSSSYGRTILPDGISEKGGVRELTMEEEEEEVVMIWNRVVEEASRMQSSTRDETLMDTETLMQLVAPVRVELEAEDYSDYLRTELMYQQAVSQEPHNSLFLSNFAQFLYLVLHDHNRAESYFKRAVSVDPVDAESLGRYARFLWLAKGNLRAAEETFLEAMSVEPDNTVHAANYADFLWSTAADNTGYSCNVNEDA